jgi:phosphohistidine phosphatase
MLAARVEHRSEPSAKITAVEPKQLFVLRHAKSSWDDPGLPDHERPLAPRGRRAVAVLHEYIRSRGIEPALVLCSSARRTRETLVGVQPGGEQLIEDDLYDADAGALIERLRRVPADVSSVMLIGHNPAMQLLVLRLARTANTEDPRLEDLRGKFPTGGLATLEFDCAWSDLGPGRARLTDLIRPKQLAGA